MSPGRRFWPAPRVAPWLDTPYIQLLRHGLEQLRLVDVRQMRQGAELRRNGHVVVGLGSNRWLAGEGVAHQGQLVARPNQKGVKAVELLKPALQRGFEVVTLAHAPLQEAGRGLAVVIGVKADALMLELAPDHEGVGNRA